MQLIRAIGKDLLVIAYDVLLRYQICPPATFST